MSAQQKAADNGDISAWRSDTASTTLHNGTRAEYVVFDMGDIVTVGAISLAQYQYARDTNAAYVTRTALQLANKTEGCDHATDACWTTVHIESPTPVHTLDLELQQSTPARYLRVLHVLRPGANALSQTTAQIWEVRVWSINGPSGPLPSITFAPTRQLQRVSVQEMLGVNSIWGWFSGSYSDWSDRWGINERASTFGGVGQSGIANGGRALFAHARNYHNLNCKCAAFT